MLVPLLYAAPTKSYTLRSPTHTFSLLFSHLSSISDSHCHPTSPESFPHRLPFLSPTPFRSNALIFISFSALLPISLQLQLFWSFPYTATIHVHVYPINLYFRPLLLATLLSTLLPSSFPPLSSISLPSRDMAPLNEVGGKPMHRALGAVCRIT